jgi:hypothetical protein
LCLYDRRCGGGLSFTWQRPAINRSYQIESALEMAKKRLVHKLLRDNLLPSTPSHSAAGRRTRALFRDEQEAEPVPNRQGRVVTIVGLSFLPENAGRSDETGATAAARSPWQWSQKAVTVPVQCRSRVGDKPRSFSPDRSTPVHASISLHHNAREERT